jgi:hypothetical protein
MKKSKHLGLFLFFLLSFYLVKANNSQQERADDLLILGQAFINLSLTEKYFDTLKITRIVKILQFEEKELASIKDSGFIKANESLYNFTYSLLYYGKAKLLFLNKKDSSRKTLLQWKSTLESAIDYFNNSEKQENKYFISYNTDYEFFGFKIEVFEQLKQDIRGLKDLFTPYFNNDIYPDFKRIFFLEKNTSQFHFDSLLQYTKLYNLPLSRYILELVHDSSGAISNTDYEAFKISKISKRYQLDLALDLISRYLQLNYVALHYDSLCKVDEILSEFQYFESELNPQDANNFNTSSSYNKMPKDGFFRNNLDTVACNRLHNKLKKITKPGNCPIEHMVGNYVGSDHDNFPERKYFFPVPAPFPSAFSYIYNYKPRLKKLKETDDYLKAIFNSAGYKNHIQYYYVNSGYAITTSLEAINKDGTPQSQDKRWNVTVAGNGKFSMFDVFKSIFFDTESDFRIFALVVSTTEIEVQSSQASIGAMQDLLINSYSSLPKDLENLVLPEKILTILVYNFHQSDIGEVPMLDISKKLSVGDHLKKSGLTGLLNNQ